jgi:hypothetical protein
MSGPLLKLIYPDRIMRRDLAAADRALLDGGPVHRVLVLISRAETAGSLVDIGADLAATRPGSELVLAHLASFPARRRLEVGAGLGGELVQMTAVMSQLHELAGRAAARGASALVRSRFSDDVPGELSAYVAAAGPDTVVLGSGRDAYGDDAYEAIRADRGTRLVTVREPGPDEPAAVAAGYGAGPDAAAALDVAAQLATARRLPLVLTGASGRRGRGIVAELIQRGVPVSSGPAPEGALLVARDDEAAASSTTVHLVVRAGSTEDIDDRPAIATPVSALEPGRQ